MPKTGTDTGTMTAPAGPGTISGQVARKGKKYIVQALLSTTETCGTGGTATFKISGHFTSEKEFTGTASKTSTEGPKMPGSGTCATGTIKFTLKFKSSKPLGS